MIKKISLIIMFVIFSINVFANCETIKMDVAEVQKNESCYTFFSVVFEDFGCESNCFTNISNFVVLQGDKILTNKSDIKTTFFGINYMHPDCIEKNVYMRLYDNNRNIVCEQNFNLEDEYIAWQNYENQTTNINPISTNQINSGSSSNKKTNTTQNFNINNSTNINNQELTNTNSTIVKSQNSNDKITQTTVNNVNVIKEEILNDSKNSSNSEQIKSTNNFIIILIFIIIIIAIISILLVKKLTNENTKEIQQNKRRKNKK